MSENYYIKDFLGEGWFTVESDGIKSWVWSKKVAFLNFPSQHKGLSLEISGCPASSEDLVIKHNGNEIYASTLKGAPIIINIPPGILSCLIKLNNHWVPQQILGTNDTRALGICLHRITPLNNYLENCNSFPSEIELGLSGKCNINPPCVMCHTRNRKYNNITDQTHLSQDIINKVKSYFNLAEFISLHGTEGEPLLFPELVNVLNMIDTQRVFTTFATNGLLLTREMSERLILAGLRQIEFSIDAATATTYNKIRNNNAFSLLLDNIRQLVILKKSKNVLFPNIVLTMVIMKENMKELPDFIELAHELGILNVIIRLLVPIENNYEISNEELNFNYYRQRVDPSSDEFKSIVSLFERKAKHYGINISSDNPEINVLFHKDILLSGPLSGPSQVTIILLGDTEKEYFLSFNKKIQCDFPWKHILIDLNGDVRFCCHTKEKLGNLHANNFLEIWNGEVAKSIRAALLENRWPIGCLSCPTHRLQSEIWNLVE